MNRKKRFVIAIVLSMVLMLMAAGVWAAPPFKGTVPTVPPGPVTGRCLETVNMGTAILKVQKPDCIRVVRLVKYPAWRYDRAPKGKVFVGDTFSVIAKPKDAVVQICYAYPPHLAKRDAKIYRLNEEAKPKVWVEIPGAKIGNGTICVSSAAGVFSLIGNP